MLPYIICDLSQLKPEYPEFKAIMQDMRVKLEAKAAEDWGKPNGGMQAHAGSFSETTIIPSLFRDMASTTMVTWKQFLSSTGAQTVMSGSNGGNLYEGYKVGLVGLAFLDKDPRITEIKMQISDQKLPRINLEEMFAYQQPCIVFEEGWILDEETGFDLYAYVECRGYQRLKLIGIQLNEIPNKLQVSNTGAALT